MTAKLIFPKSGPLRSEKLRRLVASLTCVSCGLEGSTQAAHANYTKGIGIKASDARIMALCVECHRNLDQGGNMTKEARRAYEFEMMALTYIHLMEAGKLEVV